MSSPTNPLDCPTRSQAHKPNQDKWTKFTAVPGEHRCSHCKSLHPDDALARIERGDRVTAEARPDRMQIDKQLVYFAHFNAAQKQRLVDLYNARAIRFAFTAHGWLFVTPSFMTFKPGKADMFVANVLKPFFPDTTAPTAPALDVPTIDGTTAQLAWSASTDSETGVAGYRVYVDDEPLPPLVQALNYLVQDLSGGSHAIRVTGIDGAGNESLPSNTRTVSISSGATAIKHRPGHGVIFSGFASPTSDGFDDVDVLALASEANVKFFLVRVYWARLEPAPGIYDFTWIRKVARLAQSIGKPVIFQLQDRSFSGNSANGILPSYIPFHLKPSNAGVVAKYWLPGGMDPYIALLQALAAYAFDGYTVNSHPWIEGITNCESSAPASPPADWTAAKTATQLKRWMSAARAALPNTTTFASLNFLAGQMESLVAYAASVGCGISGPDTVPVPAPPNPSFGTQAQRVFMGYHENGTTGGIDYRGIIPAMWQVQGPELGGKDGTHTMESIGNAGQLYGASHMPWLRLVRTARPNYFDDILPYLRGTPPTLALACPTSYPSCSTG